MDRTYWHKQKPGQTLFPDLLWSRPERRSAAGKLLIIGGHVQSFAAPAEAYAAAGEAGAGTVRVLLPDSLQKTVSQIFPAADYAPSTPNGSFGQQALDAWLDQAAWADGVLVAGDLGRNSETKILLEKFLLDYAGMMTLTLDAADDFISEPTTLERPETLLVVNFSQLQKLAINAHFAQAFTSDMDFLRIVDRLHELTVKLPLHIVYRHLNNLIVASAGQVSTTHADKPASDINLAAHASVWWLQNSNQPFEAITSSMI